LFSVRRLLNENIVVVNVHIIINMFN